MMEQKPLVSICCITYNHEEYIRDAIEGFLMQEVDFPMEIIIHDDASTDNTQEIIKEYAKEDDRIVPILRKENIKSTGVAVFPITFEEARGKYIAMCEGDDYWTDPHKLQKQVDCMEEIDSISLTFHSTMYKYKYTPQKNYLQKASNVKKKIFNTRDFLKKGGSLVPTATMVFRSKFIQNLPAWYFKAPTGDYSLVLILSTRGTVEYIEDVTSVYRRDNDGSWTVSKSFKERLESFRGINKMLCNFGKSTGKYYFLIRLIIVKRWIIFFLVKGRDLVR